MSMPHLFCFGLGYTAHLVARQALTLGWRVGGTCRTAEKAAALAREGIEAVVFDGSRASAAVVEALAGVTHVLDSIPPLEEGDPPLLRHGGDLAGATRTLGWAGYLSTTGVYGDCGGEWIDETRVPAPLTAGSLRRLDAEHAWLGFGARTGVAVQVFRLPGIYGPHGRSAIDALREGRARRIVKPGQVFNRIHVEDLARVLLASMECPDAGRIYNVADEEPAAADEVLAFAAALIGASLPPRSPSKRLAYAYWPRVFTPSASGCATTASSASWALPWPILPTGRACAPSLPCEGVDGLNGILRSA